jgi:hypothetical protein
MPLSAAVHLSARFTYLSPAAKICAEPVEACGNGEVWGRVVDGGYHENSGAQTAQGLLRVFQAAARRFARERPDLPRLDVQVVVITNDPASSRLCDRPEAPRPREFHAELAAPIDAFMATRTARGSQARRGLADAAGGRAANAPEDDCAKDAARQNTLEFSLAGGLADLGMTNHTIALGWLLANGSTHDMEAALCTRRHAAAVRQVQAALGAQTSWACEAGSEAKGKGTEGVRAVKR